MVEVMLVPLPHLRCLRALGGYDLEVAHGWADTSVVYPCSLVYVAEALARLNLPDIKPRCTPAPYTPPAYG